MKRMLLILMTLASVAMADDAPDFNNWTTESLKEIFLKPTHITRVHGNIKTVTFAHTPSIGAWEFKAIDAFTLIGEFLRGLNADFTHNDYVLGLDNLDHIIATDSETGYTVTRDHYEDYTPPPRWQYHFTVTKNDTTIVTAEVIPSERLGPQLILHIAEPLHPDPAVLARAAHDAEIRASNERALKRLNRAKESSVHGP